MLHIYLCEDEKEQLFYFRQKLKEYLEVSGESAKIVSARTDPEQTLADVKGFEAYLCGRSQENLQNRCPVLFFIDIELKDCTLDGFELAKELKRCNSNYQIVFLTSHEELAYKVFEYELGILDYIVKRPECFLAKELDPYLKSRLDHIFKEMKQIRQKENGKMITLECGSRLVEIPVWEILYAQSVKGKHQVEIYTMRQMMNVRQPLKDIYDMLGEGFLYVNRSCFVQKRMIREVDKTKRIAILEGGYQVEVAYRSMKDVCNLSW